jgi:membrane protein DedA with SNARE-associated domain
VNDVFVSILNGLSDLGYLGIAIGLMIEIIPSEVVLAYGGFLVLNGKIHFIGAVIAGTVGGLLAQLFLYWAGRYGGRPFLEKYGKYILISKEHIDIAEKWMDRYGNGVVFGARFIPIVRHAISIPAGITKMPITRFITLTTLALIPWSILFLYLGMTLGSNWQEIKDVAWRYLLPITVSTIILLLAYGVYCWFRDYNRRV